MADEKEEKTENEIKNIVSVEDTGPCKKKISIEIPQEKIKAATDEQYEELRKDAFVPGFRKGRVPRRLLEKRYGKETTQQIKLKLLAESSDAAIKDNEIKMLRDPEIDHEKIELPSEGSLKFDFEVEVRPEFALPALTEIPVTKTKSQVNDDLVDQEIAQLCKWSGMWTPREGGTVEANDQIIADVVMKIEGVEEEQKIDNTEIYIRDKGYISGVPVENLDQLLAGASAGDTKQTTVDVPKTYFKEEYRGKKIDISIHVRDIKWLKPATIDQNFLQRFHAESEQDLRDLIHENLQGRLEQQARTDMANQIYKYMLDNTNFDMPTEIVADQAGAILQRQYTSLLQQGLQREKIDEQMEQLQAASEEKAKEELKTFFIMDKVADELKVEVSDEEVNSQIAQIAMQRGQRPEQLKQQMEKNGSLGQFKMQVREDKCIAKLLESAKINEVEAAEEAKTAKKPKKSAKKAAETSENENVSEEKAAPKRKKPTKKKTEQ